MPRELWPLIIVALLAGLVASSVPWLVTLDPNRPEGMLVNMLQTLDAARDVDARLEIMGLEGPAITAHLQWLRGLGEEALKVSLLGPPELKGEIFTLHGRLLAHYRPDLAGQEQAEAASSDEKQKSGVIVRVTLPAEVPQGGETPLAWMSFDPREIITGLRLGSVRVSVRRERLGEGWDELKAKIAGASLSLPIYGAVDPFATPKGGKKYSEGAIGFSSFADFSPSEDWPSFGTPEPGLPPLLGPIRLEVRGHLKSAPSFRRVVVWVDPGEKIPHRAWFFGVYPGQTEEQRLLSVAVKSLRINVGLTLRIVLALPEARRTIWR